MTAAADTCRLDGKTIVVTGVGRAGQVGETVAAALGRRGATVAIIDRNGDSAAALAAAMRADGLAVTAFACDLTQRAETADRFAQIAATAGGKIHALANLAGGFQMSGSVADSDPELLQHQIAVNLGSAFGATRACIPHLRAAGGGSIVFMTASAILPGRKLAGKWQYAAAKAGVEALMRAVAQEERANGIRANALAPTAIRTGTNLASMGPNVTYVERDAVAGVIAFLCSDDASNVNGQVIELA